MLALIGGTLLGILLLALLAFSIVAARKLTARRTPDPPVSPTQHNLPFEEIRFAARDGLMLVGWHITNSDAVPRPTIVLCPGHNGSMDADLQHAPMLWQAEFDVLMFDWRAHGKSEGQRVSMGIMERRDLLGALDFLRERDVTEVGLLGFSMGGAVALRVAAEDKTGLLRAVVSDGGPARMRSAITGYFLSDLGLPSLAGRALGRIVVWIAGLRMGAPLSHADALPHVPQIAPLPVLFIHGALDPYVPLADQEAMFAAAIEPKAMWRVPDAAHRQADRLHPDEYRERVVGFFKQHISA